MEYFFQPGDRIELHPATDHWKRGARFGTVVKELPPRETWSSVRRVRVKLDKWPRPLTFRKDLVNPIDEPPGHTASDMLPEAP